MNDRAKSLGGNIVNATRVLGPEWEEVLAIAGRPNLAGIFELDGEEMPLRIEKRIASGTVRCKLLLDNREIVLQKACFWDSRDPKRRQRYNVIQT